MVLGTSQSSVEHAKYSKNEDLIYDAANGTAVTIIDSSVAK